MSDENKMLKHEIETGFSWIRGKYSPTCPDLLFKNCLNQQIVKFLMAPERTLCAFARQPLGAHANANAKQTENDACQLFRLKKIDNSSIKLSHLESFPQIFSAVDTLGFTTTYNNRLYVVANI